MVFLPLALEIIALFFCAWIAAALVRGFFSCETPFVPTLKRVLPVIAKEIALSKNSVFYDLGCGEGRVLGIFRAAYPEAAFVGIEKSRLLCLLAKILNRRFLGGRFKIIRGDFFKTDLSAATHVFLYQLPRVLDELLPKFEKELKPGATVVSVDFPFSKKQFVRKISLPCAPYKICRAAYVYKF